MKFGVTGNCNQPFDFSLGNEAMSSFDLSGNLSTLQHFPVFDIRLTQCCLFENVENSNI
jgi:hypothetical protein